MEQLRQGATVSMVLFPTLPHVCPSALQPQRNYMMIWSLCCDSNFSWRQVASWRLLADAEGTTLLSACDQLLHQADYSKPRSAQYRMWTVMLMRTGHNRGLTRLQDVNRRNFVASCFTYVYGLGRDIFINPCYKIKWRSSVFGIATRWKVRWWNPDLGAGPRLFDPIQNTQLTLNGFWLSLRWLSGRGVASTTHSHPALRLKKE